MLRLSSRKMLAGWLAIQFSPLAFASETIYQSPDDFLGQFLPGCSQQVLWLKSDARTEIEDLIGHPYHGIRARYCRAGDRTGWILDEIGKTEPITSGIVVNGGKAERVRVLVFRETRGWEVHRNAFTRQYENAALNGKNQLDQPIDGITGATLSVHALNRQVKLALFLDGLVRKELNDD